MTGYAVQTITLHIGGEDYQLQILADRQQYHDPHGHAERAGISSATWPLFGMIWPVGIALAEEMSRMPVDGLRILEVGCGMALSSLVLQRRGADITASDLHPLTEEFLQHNAALNRLAPIRYCDAPWADADSQLGQFDLIIGSDLLYEPDHAALLAGFIERHARTAAQVLIADPGRGYRGQFGKRMAAQGYTRTELPCRAGGPEIEAKGRILKFVRGAPQKQAADVSR
ncbi:MAG TPA: methyltransferase domain-containing protein [Povalibacter sp.]|nr:methyltransferase domain-containing protein [Povalibacter sp.]